MPILVASSVSPVPGDTKTARLMVFTNQDDRLRRANSANGIHELREVAGTEASEPLGQLRIKAGASGVAGSS